MLVPTGLVLEIPPGWEGQVRPRSGLALRHGITLPNAPGTIDSDYRGELGVILANLGSEPFAIRRGDRIAQLVVAPVASVEWVEAEELSDQRARRAAASAPPDASSARAHRRAGAPRSRGAPKSRTSNSLDAFRTAAR